MSTSDGPYQSTQIASSFSYVNVFYNQQMQNLMRLRMYTRDSRDRLYYGPV
jgi:hypothetical protein